MTHRKPIRWFQFSMKGLLLVTLLVATFLAGRISMHREMTKAIKNQQAEISSARIPLKITYILGSQTGLKRGQTIRLIDANRVLKLNADRENPISEWIEYGMKASELEMKDRYRTDEFFVEPSE